MTSPATAEFNIKEGDRTPAIIYDLEGSDQVTTPLDLTGSTVVFHMRPTTPGAAVKITAGVCTIVTVTLPARVSYAWAAADTDTPGNFLGEFQVTNGAGLPQTFPNTREIPIVIRGQIA